MAGGSSSTTHRRRTEWRMREKPAAGIVSSGSTFPRGTGTSESIRARVSGDPERRSCTAGRLLIYRLSNDPPDTREVTHSRAGDIDGNLSG